MQQQNFNSTTINFIKTLVLLTFALGMFCMFRYGSVTDVYNKITLLEKGRKIKAIVDATGGGEGPAIRFYSFCVNKQTYTGCYEENNAPQFALGDSITLLYLISDPAMNSILIETDRPYVKNLSALFKKSKLLHHALFEKDTI
jgi:hypothetical protein